METITTAYIFGILTVVAITLVITTVMGIVRILKQQRMIENLDNQVEEIHREFNLRIDETYQHTDSRVDKLEGKLINKLNK
mgnify:FL=1